MLTKKMISKCEETEVIYRFINARFKLLVGNLNISILSDHQTKYIFGNIISKTLNECLHKEFRIMEANNLNVLAEARYYDTVIT